MDNKNVFFISALKNGAYIAGIQILFSMVLYIFEINILNFITPILILLVTILFISTIQTVGGKAFRISYLGDEMTYGKAYVFLLTIGAFSTVFVGIYDFIYYLTADLSYLKPMVEEFIINLENSGIPDDSLQEIYENTQKIYTTPPFQMAIKSMTNFMTMNAVVALIVAIFVKKKKPIFEEDEF